MASLKLTHRGPFEAADELEESLVRSYVSLQSQLTPPYHLSTLSSAQYSHLTQALLCGILVNPSGAPSHVTHLTAVTTDGYFSFVTILLRLVNELYPKLLEQTRTQILWLFRQLISLTAAEVDNLCLYLLRQVAGGDLSPANVWLAAQLLDVIKSNWTWFSASPVMLTTALYTYLRLLPDHAMARSPPLNDLKEKETLFCVQILRERLQDCLVIGRDLVRLLQDVTFIPEFEAIWRDLLNNPTSFKALSFADIAQLYVVRTPTRYLLSRVTPEMESQIRFMLTHVRMGSQRRYQTWFAQRFLSSPESETLVCDLIRFICCVHHPTNQILQSDIVPRWAIVGWLLKCCKSNHVEANAKLSLFYDWLFFMSKTDNIMNIEPALLLMVYSIPKYVDMTHALLEFLFLLLEYYDPVRKDLIQKGVTSSIDILVSKGVVRSLECLSSCNLVASWLREKLLFHFSAYTKSDDGLKQVKPELIMQDEGTYDTMSQQVLSSVVKGGQSSATFGKEPDAGTDATMATVQDHRSDVDNSKSGEMELLSRKKRRLGANENVQSEIQLYLDLLPGALTGSQEACLSVFEKLLWSFLSAGEQSLSEKNKDIRSEFIGDATILPGSGKIGSDSSPLSVVKFAHQIADVVKKCGRDFFSALSDTPTDRLEGDEGASLTSTVLRLYVTNWRNHPLLLQLLLCWHMEGLAVGARLLCYVSRLSEEIDQFGSLRPRGASAAQDVDGVIVDRSEDELCTGLNGDGELSIESSESIGNSTREPRKHATMDGSSLKVPGILNSGSLTRKPSRIRDLNVVGEAQARLGEVHSRLRTTAADSVKSYEEYLRLVKKVPQTSQVGGNLVSRMHPSQNGATEVSGRTVAVEADDNCLGVELYSDLQTCLLWNTNRFLRVLPSAFRYLPGPSVGRNDIVRLLIGALDPQELSNFEFRLHLGEFAILGRNQDGLSSLIKNSLCWEFIEQQMFWRLLVAELHGAPSTVVSTVLKICSALLGSQGYSEAQTGLLILLKYQVPTSALVDDLLSLPPAFGRFAAVLLASWVSSHHSRLLACLQSLASGNMKEKPTKGGDEGEDNANLGARKYNNLAISVLLNSLDDVELVKNNEEEKAIKMARAAELRRALLKLGGVGGMASGSVQTPSDGTTEHLQDRKLPA